MRTQLSITAIIIAVVLLGTNILAILNGWYDQTPSFDQFMHFLGGTFVFFGLLVLRIPRTENLIATIIIAIAVGVLWEVYEYAVQQYIGVVLATPADSINDLLFDTIGILVAFGMYAFVRLSKKRYNTHNER
jgi:glycopeptide antibiotics resistance protein